jgi:hypothetical protein
LRKTGKMSQENYNVFVPSTSPELKNIADCAVSNLIPEKSKRQYDKAVFTHTGKTGAGAGAGFN